MDVLNFAHGEFLMLGMYVSYWLGFLINFDPLFPGLPQEYFASFLAF